LVEQRSEEPRVGSSILSGGIYIKQEIMMNRIQFLKQLMGGIALILLNPTKLFAKPEPSKRRTLRAEYSPDVSQDAGFYHGNPYRDFEIKQTRIVAKPQKLKAQYTIETEEDLND
jgi:hypothetical protein